MQIDFRNFATRRCAVWIKYLPGIARLYLLLPALFFPKLCGGTPTRRYAPPRNATWYEFVLAATDLHSDSWVSLPSEISHSAVIRFDYPPRHSDAWIRSLHTGWLRRSPKLRRVSSSHVLSNVRPTYLQQERPCASLIRPLLYTVKFFAKFSHWTNIRFESPYFLFTFNFPAAFPFVSNLPSFQSQLN